MNKFILAIAMISLLVVPALQAQGKTLTPFVPGADKVKIQGVVYFSMGLKALIASFSLTFRDNPVLGAEVSLNETKLTELGGPGHYYGSVRPYDIRIGNELQVWVKLPTRMPGSIVTPPFEGKQKLASYVVDNILEWGFPTPGQVINLAAYPAGEIPFRWDFSGPPIASQLIINDAASGSRIIYRMVETEGIAIPVVSLQPGKSYEFILTSVFAWCGIMGRFKMSKLAAPGAGISFRYDGISSFSTAPAAK